MHLRAWFDSLSVLVARGRAKVSAAAAASDWPKRILDMQHIDVDEHFDCGMDGVQAEFKYWDPARVGKDGSRRVPDVVCTHPRTGVEYVFVISRSARRHRYAACPEFASASRRLRLQH